MICALVSIVQVGSYARLGRKKAHYLQPLLQNERAKVLLFSELPKYYCLKTYIKTKTALHSVRQSCSREYAAEFMTYGDAKGVLPKRTG